MDHALINTTNKHYGHLQYFSKKAEHHGMSDCSASEPVRRALFSSYPADSSIKKEKGHKYTSYALSSENLVNQSYELLLL